MDLIDTDAPPRTGAELKAAAPTRRTVGMRVLGDRVRPQVTALYRPLLYRGDRYQCVCCDGHFGCFVEHRGRPNVRCPRCGAMERHRMLWWWLQGQPWFAEPGLRVLHVAPEWSLRRALRRLPGVAYRSADIASALADEHFDITSIPYPDASVDLVLCNHVLEHVPEDLVAMREIYRVLSPGGRAVLMSPIGREVRTTFTDVDVVTADDRLRVYGQEDHVRMYGADYVDRLSDVFDDVIVERPLERLERSFIERHLLDQHHAVFEADAVHVGVRSTD